MKLLFPFFFILFSANTLCSGQNTYPKDYFASPVDTRIILAGNFGEIRPNHFHAGFDIKTNNQEGMPVHAAADGYISRIKISPFGYGNALYITHPNGYTSVYGHLKSFDGLIGIFTKNAQYKLQSFELDTLLAPSALPVKKGQLIALSGNTGGSQGPHLHFEIRETATEKPVNPYLFGYAIPDNVAPKITAIAVYPISEDATVNGKKQVKKMIPLCQKGKYSCNKADSIRVSGKIGFAIECYDTETGSANKNGVFSIELQSGGKRIFYEELEKFTFENARYVNAHIDYAEKQKHNDNLQKCFVAENDQLGIYKDVINNGILNFNDDSIHWIRFIVKDYVGNATELMLKVRSKNLTLPQKVTVYNDPLIECTKEYTFEQEDIQITIPPFALYDDVKFIYSKPSSVKGTFSLLHQVMNTTVPLQKAYSLSIKPIHLPDALQPKACIISVNDKGKHTYEGGSFKDGWVSTLTKSFGNYTVAVDTIPPKIRTAFKFAPKTTVDLSKAKTIGIIATDNLSGIHKYRTTIDGKWVLSEYEFKQDLLFYTFDEHVAAGKHTFLIEVWDDKNNKSELTFEFTR